MKGTKFGDECPVKTSTVAHEGLKYEIYCFWLILFGVFPNGDDGMLGHTLIYYLYI